MIAVSLHPMIRVTALEPTEPDTRSEMKGYGLKVNFRGFADT
jgi:hypothetical protein